MYATCDGELEGVGVPLMPMGCPCAPATTRTNVTQAFVREGKGGRRTAEWLGPDRVFSTRGRGHPAFDQRHERHPIRRPCRARMGYAQHVHDGR